MGSFLEVAFQRRLHDYASRATKFKACAETPLEAYIDKLETASINMGPWGMGVPDGTLFMDTHYVQQVADQKKKALAKLQRSSIWHTGR